MVFEDGAAGRAAVDYLVETGKLVPDFWLRAAAQDKSGASREEGELFQEQVSNAVQFAMGKAGVELPDWANPDTPPPDCLWVANITEIRKVAQEPYYSTGSLYRAIIKCGGNEDRDYDMGRKLTHRIWRRLVPHFNERTSRIITEIELERGYNGHDFSKAYRIANTLNYNLIRDTPLYEFYVRQGEEGLKRVFYRIGEKALLSVGAMLFLSGEHDDLMDTAEKLEDLLNKKS